MLKIFAKNRIKLFAVFFMITLFAVSGILGYNLQSKANAAASFDSVLEQFPDTYREQLTALYTEHPNWNFEPFYVEEDWNDVILANQLVLSRNLVPTTMALKGVYMKEDGNELWYATPTAWKSTVLAGSYNWTNNDWVAFDSGSWFQASEEAICYIMDPRNWLTENNIFMFEKLSFDAEVQTEEVLKIMMDDTFMDCDYAKIKGDDDKSYTYAQVLIKAANSYGVSPIHLCARVIQEQGNGTLGSNGRYTVNGTLASGVATDDGGKTFRAATSSDKTVYYNYFNIGAGGSSKQQIINNGGKEAMDAGWTSPYLAIMGGAKKLTNNYISVGQDTLYFQKFNVVYHGSDGNLVAWKQYMQNLLAPVNEGYNTRTGYKNAGLLDSAFTFRIPVYKTNFPEEVYADPDPDKSTANPNYKLKSITVSGTDIFGDKTTLGLTPTFNMDTSTYSIIVPYTIESIDISAKAIASTSKVTGIGHKDLSVGDNTFKIVCKSEYGTSKTYKLNVTRQEGSTLLSSLKPSDGSFTEKFSKDKLDYKIYMDNSIETMAFNYKTESQIAHVILRYGDITADCAGGDTGYVEVPEGESKLYIDVYPSEEDHSAATTYTVRLVRLSQTSFEKKKLQINDSYINGFAIGDTVAKAKTRFGVKNGDGVMLNSDKKAKKDDELICTGDYVTVYDANGYLYEQYQLILYGDVNGDGKVNLYDFALIKNKIVKNTGLSGIFLMAADVNNASSDVNLYDFATIKNYIVRGTAIEQVK